MLKMLGCRKRSLSYLFWKSSLYQTENYICLNIGLNIVVKLKITKNNLNGWRVEIEMELIETLSRKQKAHTSPTSKNQVGAGVEIELWNLADMIWSLGEAIY